MIMKPQHFFLTLLMLAGVGCSPTPQAEKRNEKTEHHVPANSIYYWKTVFDLNETEWDFLDEHHVKRLYLRLFDVVPADKSVKSDFDFEAVPNATIAFKDSVPENVEIIPVVYITIDALRQIVNSDKDYAGLIVERVINIADFHDLGHISEVQLDCDWTQQTQNGYFAFCKSVKEKLEPYGIELSCTIRLWQLACACPPVDRGVLMLYNTGNVTNLNTQNSILDLDDVKSHLKGNNYGLPLDFAYPTFSWYVWFNNDAYKGLFHQKPIGELNEGDSLREERVSFEDLRSLDSLLRIKIHKSDFASVILYHLDSANLSNFSTDEIRQIYRYN